jgi:hypothetical protein
MSHVDKLLIFTKRYGTSGGAMYGGYCAIDDININSAKVS